MHIAFAILGSREYLDALGLQQLLWKYLEEKVHPVMQLLRDCFANFVGEDIELANRALGHAVRSKRGQGDLDFLQTAYLRLVSCCVTKKVRD